MLRLLVLFLFSGTMFAEENVEVLRNSIEKELQAISFFAHEEGQDLASFLLSEGEPRDWLMDIAKSDEKEYRTIERIANKRLEQLGNGETLFWAKNHLQLLRNRLYAVHSDPEELAQAGIKRRSQPLSVTAHEFASKATNFAVRTAALVNAYQTIQGLMGYGGAAAH